MPTIAIIQLTLLGLLLIAATRFLYLNARHNRGWYRATYGGWRRYADGDYRRWPKLFTVYEQSWWPYKVDIIACNDCGAEWHRGIPHYTPGDFVLAHTLEHGHRYPTSMEVDMARRRPRPAE